MKKIFQSVKAFFCSKIIQKLCKHIKEFLHTFFFIFGLMQLIFFVREQFWPFGDYLFSGRLRDIYWLDVLISFISALIFTVSYHFIISEWLDNRICVKLRIFLCGLPCIACGFLLTYTFGLQYYMPDIKNEVISLWTYFFSYCASVAIYVVPLFAIAKKHQKQSKIYNSALEEYKKEIT